MTDKERLESLLRDFEIPLEGIVVTVDETEVISESVIFGPGVEKSDKVFGYTGFITEFEFDREGNFISMAVWE